MDKIKKDLKIGAYRGYKLRSDESLNLDDKNTEPKDTYINANNTNQNASNFTLMRPLTNKELIDVARERSRSPTSLIRNKTTIIV